MSQTNTPVPLQVLTPETRTVLTNRTNQLLLKIIRANSGAQFASQAACLTAFRDVMSLNGKEDDVTLLKDFREQVPLTEYEADKPWMTRFDERPCSESRVDNLLAPGLPYYIAVSSSTSGKDPKLFPSYQHANHDDPPLRQHFDFSDAQGPTAWIFHYGYRELRDVEREPGQVVKRVPFCLGSGGGLRMRFGWDVDSDESWMPIVLPGQVSPWAANLILQHRSYLMIHAVFCLACRDLDQIFTTFIAYFFYFVRYIDEEWEMLIACIRDGTIPELDGITHLRTCLQAPFRPNPKRAAELYRIGRPSSSCEGWAAQIWPRLRRLGGICSGSFGTPLPQVRLILGPTIAIRTHGYASSECLMSVFFDPEDLDTFVFETKDVIEFIPPDAEAISGNVLQAWNLEAGKHYQIVLTTRNGLWRYLLDDVIEIVGFAPHNGSPVFKYSCRKLSDIRLPAIVLSSAQIVAAIQRIRSLDLMQVLDFTAVHDERATPSAVGFFVELTAPPGSDARLIAQRLSDALGDAHTEYQVSVESGEISLPTIRVVKPGTFTEYRQWRCEKMNVGLGQVKVPVVLLHPESQEWILQRVIQELY